MKQQRKLYFIAGVILIAGVLLFSKFFSEPKRPAGVDEYIKPNPIKTASSYVKNEAASANSLLTRLMIGNQMTEKDLYRVNFAKPWDDDYLQEDKINLFPEDYRELDLSDYTTHPEYGRYIFTIANRVKGKTLGEPELLAVFPYVKEEICQELNKIINASETHAGLVQSIDLTPYPNMPDEFNVIVLPERSRTLCLKAEKSYHYVLSLRNALH